MCALLLSIACLWAQDDDVEDDDEEYVQLPLGIRAEYQTTGGETVLSRMEPMPRLYGAAEGSVHSRVPADRFGVTWRGRLLVPYDEQYTFWIGESSLKHVRFTLAGRPVSFGEPIELEFGNVPLELSGWHDGPAPAFELAWKNPIFAREIIPPHHLVHLPPAARRPEILSQAIDDSGAALAELFGCFRCHEGPRAWVDSLGTELEPELLLPGPRLSGVGLRIHRAWLGDFLKDPAANRPGTRMPAQLGDGPEDQATIATIVAYLTSSQTAEIARALPQGSAEQGEELYRDSGCAACHEPPESAAAAVPSPVIPSLDALAEK